MIVFSLIFYFYYSKQLVYINNKKMKKIIKNWKKIFKWNGDLPAGLAGVSTGLGGGVGNFFSASGLLGNVGNDFSV